ncbi:Uncharacterised protein [Mycobacterium tuberculosis]|uniref:Uncharacterized protein n=4 Tax=Mycobacterium tuberculosis complex TaxID=77643 RepID=A0A655JDB3_MYCTX|nr:Uncharacterised protein [Mycobacterium tuberculosis]
MAGRIAAAEIGALRRRAQSLLDQPVMPGPKWSRERTWMSPDPQEGGQALPRQADPTGAVELFRKPANRGAVPRGTLVDGIEQEVCVNEH